MNKIILMLLFTTIVSSHAFTQNRRVKRQGVTPTAVGDKPENKFTYNYKISQFAGKWQEVKRIYKNGQQAKITDTVFIYFKENNKVETRDGSKTFIKGEAMLEAPGNILVAAADVYTIQSATKDTLVLDDQDTFIHILIKVNQFWVETVGKTPVATEAYEQAIVPDIEKLMGNWSIYRRHSKPGATNTETMLIKQIKINKVINITTASGEITCYKKDVSETLPCTISINGEVTTIKTASYEWKVPVYKADGKEWIFGEKDKLLYFAKPL